MLKKIIFSIAAVAVASIGGVIIADILNNSDIDLQSKIIKDVQSERTDSEKTTIALLDEFKKQKKERSLREDIAVSKELNAYKQSISYDKQKQDACFKVNEAVKEFKEKISYDAQREKLKNSFDFALSEWEKENNYISKINYQNKRIEDAKHNARNQGLFADLIPSENDDNKKTVEKIKEVISESENRTRKDAKREIKAIKKERENFKESLKKVMDEEVKELDAEVEKVRSAVYKESSESIADLEKLVKDKEREIRKAVESKRSNEEKELDSDIDIYTEKVDEILKNEAEKIRSRRSSTTKVDEIAYYFKSRNWSKLSVALFLGTPVAIVAVGSAYYCKFIFEIISKM